MSLQTSTVRESPAVLELLQKETSLDVPVIPISAILNNCRQCDGLEIGPVERTQQNALGCVTQMMGTG